MTQEIQWGPAIAVDGKRPAWLGDDDLMQWSWCGHVWYGAGHPANRYFLADDDCIDFIRLPADHPHYPQTEEAPIDWSGELEAVHEDGRVQKVRLSSVRHQPDSDGDYTLEIGSLNGFDVYRSDGSSWSGGPWRIRNVTQPTPQADTKPDLTARMEALVRRMAVFDAYSRAGASEFRDEARAIVALLPEPEADQPFDVPRAPCMTISEVREMVAKGEDAVIATMLERGYALPEPVDEDLIEARKLAADWAASFSHEWEKPIRDGEKDADPHSGVSLARAALASGRALALAGEKEA